MDISELKKVYKDGFPEDSDEYSEYFIRKVKKCDIITLKENGSIVSVGYIVPKKAVVFLRNQKLAYLSALSTLSPMRGKGRMATVVIEALNKLYDRGYSYAALNPFNPDYYTRYGFSTVNHCSEIACIGQQPFFKVRATMKDAPLMAALERKMYAGLDGYLVPSVSRIKDKFAEFNADGISAYLLYNDKKPFGYYFDESEISAYATDSFNDFVSASALNGRTVTDFRGESQVWVQARIVNAAEALRNYNFSAVSDIIKTFKITDTVISGNNICVSLTVKDGIGRVSTAQSADEIVDIAALGESLFKGSANVFVDKY